MRLLSKILFVVLCFTFVTNIYSQEEIKFEQPVLISSAGQSADVKLAGLIMKRQKIASTIVNMAQVKDLEGVKTLVVVPGFSSKGLGAAGVSADDEMNRVKDLLAAAKKDNIPVLMMHIGGNARRKGQSDKFTKVVADAATYMIVVKQADEDNFFTDLAKELNIPLVLVEKIPSTAEPLGKLFN